MSLAILDNLQSLDVDSKSAFADAGSSFSEAGGFATGELGSSNFNVDASGLMVDIDAVTQNSGGNAAVPTAPFSVGELQTQLSGKLDSLSSLNAESLQQAIPENPGADSFKGLAITAEVNSTVGNLTTAITGSENFGKLNVPASQNSPFTEFQQFLTNAGAFPARVLDAILTAFKKFLDQLSHPEVWLEDLSAEALTEIFVEQIRGLTDSLPNTAIACIGSEITQRQQTIVELQTFLTEIEPATLNRQKIAGLRHQVKSWLTQIDASHEAIEVALKNLQSFDIAEFQTALTNLPNGSGGQIDTLSVLFKDIETFVTQLEQRIGTVTEQLHAFTQKILTLIQQAIDKVGSVATTIVDAISDKIAVAGKALDQVAAYLKEAIAKLTDFVQKACDQSDQMVKPLKNACSQFASKAVTGIEQLASTIQQQTQKFQQSIATVNETIETKLNRQQLEQKIRELLGKVTGVLDSPSVKNAIDSAEQGIDQVVAALQKVSLEPAFQLAIQKTNALETDLKKIDVSKLGTAQKAALKVGTKIIQQVDVPGIVTPELTTAFDAVLDPLVNLVNSVQGECNQIDLKIAEFKPGTLAANALKPYIDQLVTELNKYKPSVVLEQVRQLYNTLLTKMEALNPDRLLQLLEQLYEKLVAVIESLSPESLTQFLNEKLKAIAQALDNLPVEQLVNRVIDSIGDVEKLLGGLGLDSVLNSGFWRTLEEVLTISLQDKIQQVDAIKAEVVRRVNGVDEAALKAELKALREAIAEFASDAKQAIQTATANTTAALAAYQQAIPDFTTAWQQQLERLQAFTPPPEFSVDYQDLLERLTTLYQQLSATDLKAQVDRLTEIVQAGGTRLQPTKTKLKALVESSTVRTDEEIIAAFKQVIPDEIEAQLTAPIKRILTSLDRTLSKPREVLDDIKKVIQRLATAPQELALILKQLASALGQVIRGAITKVKETIQQFNFNFINDLHRQIVEKVKDLSPLQILNSFYDASDFKGDVTKLLQRLRGAEDAVSKYILAQLSDAQRALIASSDSEGAQKALMQGLNQLLKDARFYSVDRFQSIQLPREARTLIGSLPQLELKQIIRLNRLLLEAVYASEITLSLQSIYPLFLEKLAQLYPSELVKTLDVLHARIVQVILDFPKALETALNAEYQKVVAAYRLIRAQIDTIFLALIARLRGLQSELGIGLEDVSDAYNRLLVALPI